MNVNGNENVNKKQKPTDRSPWAFDQIAPTAIVMVLLSIVTTVARGADATQPATAPSISVAIDPTTPKGALKSLAVAMDGGDAQAIRSLLQTSSPLEERMVGAMTDEAAAIAAFNRSMIKRFGIAEAAAALGGDPAEQLKQSMHNIDTASERIDGDTATISTGPSETMTLKKSNGTWRVSVAALSPGTTPAAVDERIAVVTAQMKAMQDVTAGILAGKYATATDAVAAIRARLGGPPPATSP